MNTHNRTRAALTLAAVAMAAFSLITAPAKAAISYTEAFDGTGGALNGKTPTTGGGTWSANSIATNNGVLTANAGSAILPFTPVVNQTYTLSIDLNYIPTGDGWIALGFSSSAAVTAPNAGSTADRFSNANVPGYAWVLYTEDDFISAFEGSRTAGSDPIVNYPSTNGPHTLSIILNTTGDGTKFTADFLLDGVSMLSGGPTQINFPVSTIKSAGFSQYGSGAVTGSTVDNFSLSSVQTAPDVNIETPDMITWSGEPVILDATVVNNDDGNPQAALTMNWSTNAPAGYTVNFAPGANVVDPTVTITKDANTGDATVVTVTLAVNNVGSTNPDVTDTMTIDVYDDACKAAIGKDLASGQPAYISGNCIADLGDLVEMAAAWLVDYTLTAPQELAVGTAIGLRIMPLGDSITAGYTDQPAWTEPFEFGYRSGLYTRLTNAGYDFQFVGQSVEPWNGVSTVPPNTPIVDLRPLGQDHHRGYGGETILETNSKVAGYIANDDPDVILLLIGINGGTNRANPTELNTLVNTIFTASPDVHLIVAQITPYGYYLESIDDYNIYIRDTLVPTKAAQGYNISTVDMYSLFLSNPNDRTSIRTDMHSNTATNHPKNVVYDQMAQVWFNGLAQIISHAPSVNAGDDMITWSGKSVPLNPNVVNNDEGVPQAALTYAWSADPAAGVVFSATNVEAPTVTITKATSNPSTVTLTLAVNNVGSGKPSVEDTMTIDVYDTACKAAISMEPAAGHPTDIGKDCITDLDDLAELGRIWLNDASLTVPIEK
jgi:hypothetical protein